MRMCGCVHENLVMYYNIHNYVTLYVYEHNGKDG